MQMRVGGSAVAAHFQHAATHSSRHRELAGRQVTGAAGSNVQRLLHFLPTAETGISIPLTIRWFCLYYAKDYHITFGGSSKTIIMQHEEAVGFVEQFKKWPFRVHIDDAVIALLHQLAPATICSFYAEEPLNFEPLREIIEKYRVEDLVLNAGYSAFSIREIEYFLRQPFYELFLGSYVGSLDLAVSSEIPILFVGDGILTPHLLRLIVDKFLETDKLDAWNICPRHSITKTELMAALEDFSNCRFSHSGLLPERRPLVFIPDNYEGVDPKGEFYILRDDGELVYLANHMEGDDSLDIKFVDISSGPAILSQ